MCTACARAGQLKQRMPENAAEPIPQAEIIVLQGDDELSIQEIIQELMQRCDADGFGQMNAVRLDGRSAQRGEIATALSILPLGAEKRLVVLEHALAAAKGGDGHTWLSDLMKGMPSSSILVLVVQDTQKYANGHMQWLEVGEKHWLRKAVRESGHGSAWLEKLLPSMRDMPAWIMQEAEKQGARFEQAAALELANLIGVDLFQARQEISKALSFVGAGEIVTCDVVRLLCSQTREEDIFALVDALGRRDAKQALRLLNALSAVQPVLYIFSMVVRQIRLLLMAREVRAEGGGENEIASACQVKPFVAHKLQEQCARFSAGELEGIYRQLDQLDEDSKTGRASLDVGLEMLVARISRKVVN